MLNIDDYKINMGLQYIHNDSKKAFKLFDEVLKINSKDINALNGIGSALLKLNKYDDAETYFDKSLDIEISASALLNKGLIYKNRGEYDNALTYYDGAILLKPELIPIINLLKKDIFEILNLKE